MSERDTRAHRSADRSRSAKSRRRGTDEADDHRPREKTSSKARESKRSTDVGREADSGSAREADSGSGRKADSGSGIGPRRAAAAAAAYVQEMTGRPPEGLTALERTEDGWRIGVE